jgi:aminodeoxychorismate synthase component I
VKTNSNSGVFLIDKGSFDHFIIGEEPGWVFQANHRVSVIEIEGKRSCINSCSLSELQRVLQEFVFSKKSQYKIAVGYLSYDLKNLIEDGNSKNPDDTLIYFAGFKDYKLVKKHNIYKKLQKKYINYFNISKAQLKKIYQMPFKEYKDKILRIKQYIEEGEVYQVNFTHRQIYDFIGDPFELYLRLSQIAKPAHGFYLDTGEKKILSLSPERFFRIKNGIIETFPIKGTIKRGRTKKEDLFNRCKLLRSEKDRAEHLMIVDLLRNDLGKICKAGSVGVDGLFNIRSYPTVHHMVSRIHGLLNRKNRFDEIIRAIFPGGSVTGAPKIRAMQIIEELEDYSRGVYTGSTGYILPDGSMDFNIAIRTMIIEGRRAYYSAGGGIVYDSDPWAEYEETITKTEIINKVMERLRREEDLLSEREMAP